MVVTNQEIHNGFSRYKISDGIKIIEIELSDEELVLSIGEEVDVNE